MTTLVGGSGDDSLSGSQKSDTISGGTGDDYIDAGNGEDIVEGGDDDDTIFGGNGQDLLFGGRGNDYVSGGNGRDRVFGGSGNDVIGGDAASAATLTSENGSETLYGDGYDSYAAYLAQGPLSSAPGNDTIYSGNGTDTIYGDNGNNRDGGSIAGGNDIIHAGNGADLVWGENGNDTLYGESGNDTLYGGAGSDTLIGGLGADLLTGGTGNDLFRFNATSSSSDSNTATMDTITDFIRGQDKIDVTALLGSTDLVWGNHTATANGVWYQDQPDGTTLVYADVDGNAATAELVIKLNGTYDLSQSDFLGLVNSAPVITSDGGGASATLSMAENATAVTTVTATDAEADTLSYSIVGGADMALFTINTATGALAFVSAPNVELPTDADANNIYDVTVRVSDGTLFDDQTIAVTVTDVDEFDVTTPVDSDAASNAVDESAAVGTVVGIMAFAADADATTNTVTYSLTDDAGGRFAIDSNTGEVTVAGPIDREGDGASLNIEVTATSADGSTAAQTFAIAINDVDEFDVSTLVDSDASSNAVDENAAIGTVVGVTAFASDADATTNTITYSLSDSAGGRFAINSSTGEVTVAGTIDREGDGASLNIEVTATSADGSTAAQTFAIAVNDVDEFDVSTPIDSDVSSDAVDENATVGTSVGIMAFAADADATTNTVTYSLTDNAGGRFAIDSSTGEVTVAGAIDREGDGASLNIEVTATSADGSTAAQTFAIAVNDVDEFDVSTPIDSDAGSDAVDENAAVGTSVGIMAFAADADATTNTVTYSLTDNAGGRFTINSSTGEVTIAGAIDREGDGASLNIEVTATSADGSSSAQTFAIAVNDVDEFDVSTPIDSDATSNAVNENAAVGTTVGIMAFASDADATTNTVTYSLTDNAGGRFAIDSSTGEVTVAGAIDREGDGASLNIEVTATSADGSTAAQTFAIAINDVDEFDVSTPIDSDATSNAVDENATIGTSVGIMAFAADADATTNTVSYSLTDDAGGRFTIDSSTGEVTVAGAIDREGDGASLNIEVTATSADGSTAAQTFAIAVNDVDEFDVSTPVDNDAASNAVNENAAVGTSVGIMAFASDADATTNTVTYSLTDDAGGRFAIDSNTGEVTVAGPIDREGDGASLNIEVTATSADGSTAAQTFAIAINDVDEFDVSTPIDSDATSNAIDENATIGTSVGIMAFAADADATTNTVSYSLTDDAGGRFTIDSSTGEVTVAGAIDREGDGASLNIEVTATSADGSSAAQTFAIAVNDVDEFDVSTPVDNDAASNAVNENAAVGTSVGIMAFASDADATTNTVSYSLTDDAGGRFAINSSTGEVTVAGTIDREGDGTSLNIEVTATSADGSTAAQTFAIVINDVDEFDVSTPVDSDATSNVVDENATIGTSVGIMAFAADADATTNTVTYSLSDNAGSRFAINSSTGEVTVAGAIDREADGASLEIEVTATSADGSTAAQTFAIAINDVDEFDVSTPVDSDAASNAVNENAAVGTSVGIMAFASDADATTNTVSYSLTDDAGGRFAIDSSTGEVTVAGAIDREGDGASLNIEVTATSADSSTAAQTFAIAINDVDEFDVSTPVDNDAASNVVNENAAVGTTVGIMAFASDADATTNTVTYSLTDNAGGRFAINNSTGEVTVADGSLLNYEAAISHNITVQASSSDGSTSTQLFSIAVTNVNETPVITSDGGDASVAVSLAENTAAVTTVTASDVDAGTTLSYSIVGGADMALFTINTATGALAFASAPNFEAPTDAGANNIYDVTVRVSDGALFDDQAIAVTVTNVNEAPVNTVPGAQSTNEDTAKSISGLSIADEDAGAGSVTVTLSVTHGKLTVSGGTAGISGSGTTVVTLTGTVAAINSTLAAIVSYSPNADYTGNDTLTMLTNDNGSTGSGGALSDSDSIALTVVAINDAPLAATDLVYVSNGTTVTISSNALLGNDTDSDGLALTITGVGGALGGVSGLSLNANGTITFASSNASSGSFTYTVDDGAGGTSTGTVNVTIVTTTGTINTIDLSSSTYQASYIDGKNGNDPLTGSGAADIFLGGAGDDTLLGGAGDDVLKGGGGNDTLNGGTGTDLLDLSDVSGGFTLVLGAGGSGTATVNGTDTYSNMEGIIGGSGNDTLTGNSGDNVLRGGIGSDILLDGGAGTDLLDLSDGTAAITFTLTQSGSNTNVNLSSIGLSTVTGDNYANMEGVIGTAFADTLNGSSGNDILKGGGGNDILSGGGGDDVLSGGAGADTITGGLGVDTIKLFASDPGSVDTITDFTIGAGGDVLSLADLLIGYTGVDLTSYVDAHESGSTTIVSVDRDGGGAAYTFQDVVVLDGVLGQTALTLQASGNLHLI